MSYIPEPLWQLSTTITHLDAQLDAMSESADTDTGELSAAQQAVIVELLTARDVTEAELNDRLNGMARYARNLEANAETLTTEIDRLTKRKQSAVNRVERIKAAIMDVFKLRRIDKPMKFADFTVNVAGNGGKAPLVFADGVKPDQIPEQYRKADFDNAAIRAALEAGETLGFASLGERGKHVRF